MNIQESTFNAIFKNKQKPFTRYQTSHRPYYAEVSRVKYYYTHTLRSSYVCACFKEGIGSLIITSIRIRLLLLSLIYAKWSAPAAYVYVLFAKQNENNNLALGFAEEQTAAQAQKYHRVGEKGVNRKRKYALTHTLTETWGHSHTHTHTHTVSLQGSKTHLPLRSRLLQIYAKKQHAIHFFVDAAWKQSSYFWVAIAARRWGALFK